MTEEKALHIVRNPYGFSEDEIREARLYVCDKMESYKDAYLNMREFAESKGIDTRAYG